MTRDPYDWVMGTAGALDQYGQPVAAAPPGALAELPQPVAVPLGQLAEQPSYDPFEAAAARVRFGAKPAGGRQVGAFTSALDQLPEQVLSIPKKALSVSEAWRQGERTPEMAGELFNTTLDVANVGTPFAQAGALGSAGGKAVMGELAAATPAPPFYSAVERAVQGSKQPSAPGQQWLGTLRNQPGVKPEELQHLGLEGFLGEQQGSVPKQALLDRIAANKLEVGEVWKGDAGPKHQFGTQEEQVAALARLNSLQVQHGNLPWGDPGRQHLADQIVAQERAMRDIAPGWGRAPDTTASPTKFSQYTLPGGENYREMLLTLPEAKSKAVAEFEKFKRDIELKHNTHLDSPYDVAKWAGSDAADKYETLLRAAQDAQRQPGGMNFKSSHYDEPNILAHVRYNDRVIDGKKTLFVEEVQSDWHQAGKKKGYGTEEQRKQAITDQLNVLGREYYELPATASAQRNEITDRMNVLHDQMTAVRREGTVPDAPFKTTWPELAMKRVIREAAEKGYDKVAWTPGSVQADRYDLSKHVKEIEYIKRGDKYELGVTDIRGSGVDMPNKVMTLEEIEETLGKEMAEKISKGEGQKFRGHEGYTLSGLDLKVGGEGMKGFYDEILPATVNKLVKKHGGRVTQADMTAATAASPERVHTIEITPQLREAAMKGFPLFTAGGVAATGVMGELARQDRGEQ